MEFDWDEHNLFHIAMHGVTREEVETALLAGPVSIRNELRNREERTSQVGEAFNGRILFIVIVSRGSRMRVVTAFGANKLFRETYWTKKGRTQRWLN